MYRNKRLQKFDTLGLIDKIKVIKEYLTSPWFAVQLRGMQRMEDLLSESRNPADRDFVLGLATSAFAQEKHIRRWASEILKTHFPKRWAYIGAEISNFYEHPEPKGLITIVRKALDILEQPEMVRQGVSTYDTPVFFQPNHRHGLDLLWLGTESGIFDWPYEIGDASRSLYSDFIQVDFFKEFPSIEIGEVLFALLKVDKDPFVLRRIVDFFGRTALPVNTITSAFDALLGTIQPLNSSVDYFEYPIAYYQVIEYAIHGAATLYAYPWYEEIRLVVNQTTINTTLREELITHSNQLRLGPWPPDSTWLELLQHCKELDPELGDSLGNAYDKTKKNREQLIESLKKIIYSQAVFINKPDLHKDLNCRTAIEVIGKIGGHEHLLELWERLNRGMDCKLVSFMLQGWCLAAISNIEHFPPAERQKILKHVLVLGRASSTAESIIKNVMGNIKLTPKEYNNLSRNSLKHIRNHLNKFYIWGADELEGGSAQSTLGSSLDRDKLLEASIEYYQSLGRLPAAEHKEQLDDLLGLWNNILTYYEVSNNTQPLENENSNQISEALVGQLKAIIQMELRQALDHNSLIERFERFAFLINKLELVNQIQSFYPTDDELININRNGFHLRLIRDEALLQAALENSRSSRKLILWLELLVRKANNAMLECPVEISNKSADSKQTLDLLSAIPELLWHEAIPELMQLPLTDNPRLQELIRWLLRDTRFRPLFGFQLGGINKFIRKHLSGEAAYFLYDEWSGETEVSDTDLNKFAWLNLIKVAEYAYAHQLPLPVDIQHPDLSEDFDLSGSHLIQKLSKLDREITMPGVMFKGVVQLEDTDASHRHQHVAFAAPLLDTENIWRVVTQPLEFTSAIKEKLKNFHPGQALQLGDCVIGKPIRMLDKNDQNGGFLVDLGPGNSQGVWNEGIQGLSPFQVLQKVEHLELFVIVASTPQGQWLLSRNAFLAQFKEQLIRTNEPIELDVLIDELLPDGKVRVRCGSFPLDVDAAELSWADPGMLKEVLKTLHKQQLPVQSCLFRSRTDVEVQVSFKRRKPIWQVEDLALRFGTQPFQLIFVATEKNDLVFEVQATTPNIDGSHYLLIPPGTLCQLSVERLVDRDELNYHPLLEKYAPKQGELFEARWLLPNQGISANRPWQQENQAVLQIRRTAPFRYDLHREFSVNAFVQIEPEANATWSTQPATVRISDPQFEDAVISASLAWGQLQPAGMNQLLSLQHSHKISAKILYYEAERPVVLPIIQTSTKFEKNKQYTLKVAKHNNHGRRNYLSLTHWSTDRSLVIYEEQLGYNPEITLRRFPIGSSLDAFFLEEKNGELCFSLLQKNSIRTISSAEHSKLPIQGAYLGLESQGYEQYVWLETEPGVCIRIARKYFEFFTPTHFEIGDPVILQLGNRKNSLSLDAQNLVKDNPIRKLLDDDPELDGVIISEADHLVKLSPPGLRSLVGRLSTEQQYSFNTGTRLKVKIDNMRLNFRFDPPRLNVDLVPVVQPKDQLGFAEFQNRWNDNPHLYARGRVTTATTKEVEVQLFNYSPDIHFIVPYNHLSRVPERRNYRYYQSVANPRLNRNFQVLQLDEPTRTVTLSLAGGYAENLRRDNKINPDLGIDKGEACLLEIIDHGAYYVFETATLVKCKVAAEDIEITKDQRHEYLNWDYQGGMFDFRIYNSHLTLNSIPTLPIKEAVKSLKNQVLLGRLTKDDGNWKINFIGNAIKKYAQLLAVKALLDPQVAENFTRPLNERDLVSVVFKRFDSDQTIAYFIVWNYDEIQRNEIEVQVYTPSHLNGEWILHPQGMQQIRIHPNHLTAATSLRLLASFGDSKRYFHSGTLNFNPESWYRAIYVKRENKGERYSYISFRDCEPQNIGSLDRYFAENPNDSNVVFTVLRDAARDPNYLLVERLPGVNYRIPWSRFDMPEQLKHLLAADRVLVKAVKSEGITYRFKIVSLLKDKWLETLFPNLTPGPSTLSHVLKKKVTLEFVKWNPDLESFDVCLPNQTEKASFRLQRNVLPPSQRDAYLWLKPGDQLRGHVTIAHEDVRYSEHGGFQIVSVNIGPEHTVALPGSLQPEIVALCQITEIQEQGFAITFPNFPNINGNLADAEAHFLTESGCQRDELLGQILPVQILALKDTGVEASYDRYVQKVATTIPAKSILPGKVMKECARGNLMQFPGFVSYVPSQNLLNGFFGKGTLPQNRIIECLLKEWPAQPGAVLISHVDIPDTFAREPNITARIISINPEYVLVQYEHFFGVIDPEYIPTEIRSRLETDQSVFLGEYFVRNKRYLSLRQTPSPDQRQRHAWQRICDYFPNWMGAILQYYWDMRKLHNEYNHDWLAFGHQLTNLNLPISYSTVSAVIHSLAQFGRYPDPSQLMPETAIDDWPALLLSVAKLIQAPQLAQAENNPFALLGAAEYFLIVGELPANSGNPTNQLPESIWEIVYDLLVRIDKQMPGLLAVTIGQVVAGMRSNRLIQTPDLVDDLVQKFGSNFGLFLQPYWPEWKKDIEQHSIDQRQTIPNIIEKFIPGNLTESFDFLNDKIQDGRSKPGLKIDRLYYQCACLHFIQQEGSGVLENLQEAENHLNQENNWEDAHMWQQRIEELRLLQHLVSSNLQPRPANRMATEEDNFVTVLIRYCRDFLPDHTSNPKAFVFSTGLTLALRDYSYLHQLVKSRENQSSFFYDLLDVFLQQHIGIKIDPAINIPRDGWLVTGKQTPNIVFK